MSARIPDIYIKPQAGVNWCWAACGLSVIEYYVLSSYRKCDLVNEQFGRSDCRDDATPKTCDEPGHVHEILRSHNCYRDLRRASGMYPSDLDHEFKGLQPVVALMYYPSGLGHSVVLCEVDTYTEDVNYLDPADATEVVANFWDLISGVSQEGGLKWDVAVRTQAPVTAGISASAPAAGVAALEEPLAPTGSGSLSTVLSATIRDEGSRITDMQLKAFIGDEVRLAEGGEPFREAGTLIVEQTSDWIVERLGDKSIRKKGPVVSAIQHVLTRFTDAPETAEFLRFPALGVNAVRCNMKGRKAVYAVGPSPAKLEEETPYEENDFLKVVAELAQSRLSFRGREEELRQQVDQEFGLEQSL